MIRALPIATLSTSLPGRPQSMEAKFSPAASEEHTTTSGDDVSDAAADDAMDPVEAISQLLKAIQNSTGEEEWRWVTRRARQQCAKWESLAQNESDTSEFRSLHS